MQFFVNSFSWVEFGEIPSSLQCYSCCTSKSVVNDKYITALMTFFMCCIQCALDLAVICGCVYFVLIHTNPLVLYVCLVLFFGILTCIEGLLHGAELCWNTTSLV